jgi:hypothetical protein
MIHQNHFNSYLFDLKIKIELKILFRRYERNILCPFCTGEGTETPHNCAKSSKLIQSLLFRVCSCQSLRSKNKIIKENKDMKLKLNIPCRGDVESINKKENERVGNIKKVTCKKTYLYYYKLKLVVYLV